MYYGQPELLREYSALDKPFAESKMGRENLLDKTVVDVFRPRL